MSLLMKLFGLDASAHLERAKKYEQVGKLGMARLELETSLEIVGMNDTPEREKINAWLDRLTAKEQVDAESRAQEALKSGDRQKARYYFNVALSRLEEGDPEYDRLITQLSLLPEDPEEVKLESELEALLQADEGIDFVERQRALEFWKSGYPPYKEEYYFNKALNSNRVLEQAGQVTKNPNDADACFNFGVTLAQLGLINKALDQVRQFVKLRPDDRDGHFLLANLLADQGYDDEAIREFEKALQIDPGFLEAYFYLAEHYVNLGDEQRAQRIFEHLVAQDKSSDLAEEARSKLEEIRSKGAAGG